MQRVALMKGAQIGGTECGDFWIGYVIDQAPGPMMAVTPTVSLLAAVTLVAEVGDFTRFANPRQLMAYLGLVPAEPVVATNVKPGWGWVHAQSDDVLDLGGEAGIGRQLEAADLMGSQPVRPPDALHRTER